MNIINEPDQMHTFSYTSNTERLHNLSKNNANNLNIQSNHAFNEQNILCGIKITC